MKNKILKILITLVMLINVFAFSSCANSELDAKLAELKAQIAQLQEQNANLQVSITEQQDQIEELQEENEDLQTEIPELVAQYNELDNNEEFLLYISTPQNIYDISDDVIVEVILYNLKGEEMVLGTTSFQMFIPTKHSFSANVQIERPTSPIVMQKNGFYEKAVELSIWDYGTHEVTCRALIWLNEGQENERSIWVTSNTITVTVLNKE